MPPPYKRLEHNPAPSECSDIVTIKIPSGKEYAVHTHLLAHYSRYCQQKLNQRRKKATRCIELSLFATEDTISLFIEWIYVKHIMREEGQHGFGERTNPPPDFHENLIKAFSFGDFIEAIQFQNYIMRPFKDTPDYRKPNLGRDLVNIWRDALEDSGMRRFFGCRIKHRAFYGG